MADSLSHAEKLRKFGKFLRDEKHRIDAEYVTNIKPVLSEIGYEKYTLNELHDLDAAINEVLASFEISNVVGNVKSDLQQALLEIERAKCNALTHKTEVRKSMLRQESGRRPGEEMKYKQHTVKERDDGIESMEDVLKSLQEISKTVVKVKDEFQEAKIHALQLQLRKSQIREQSGRSLGQRNDSGCFSADSRILSTGSNLIVHPSDDNIEEESAPAPRSVTSLHTEPVQHEDISQSLNKDDDSTC